jgi:hypothetical protein
MMTSKKESLIDRYDALVEQAISQHSRMAYLQIFKDDPAYPREQKKLEDLNRQRDAVRKEIENKLQNRF